MENGFFEKDNIEKIEIATKNINAIIKSNEFDNNLKFELIILAIDIINQCVDKEKWI